MIYESYSRSYKEGIRVYEGDNQEYIDEVK